tara:strand:+ start:883 stop:1065 length:183 start_codon:yes stop_codon:yes gene_type:complete
VVIDGGVQDPPNIDLKPKYTVVALALEMFNQKSFLKPVYGICVLKKSVAFFGVLHIVSPQ